MQTLTASPHARNDFAALPLFGWAVREKRTSPPVQISWQADRLRRVHGLPPATARLIAGLVFPVSIDGGRI